MTTLKSPYVEHNKKGAQQQIQYDYNSGSVPKTPKRTPISAGKTVKVILSDNVLSKIRTLCKTFEKDEWSGMIFYNIVGELTNPEAVLITIDDLYLLDLGTSAHTFYEVASTPRIAGYRLRTNQLRKRVGHIHSHNNMDTYFSGPDNEELDESVGVHLMYLSVIVNNKGAIVGKLAFEVQEERVINTTSKIKDNEGNFSTTIDSKNSKEESKKLYYYDCEFSRETDTPWVGEEASIQIKAAIEAKKAKQAQLAQLAQLTAQTNAASFDTGASKNYNNHIATTSPAYNVVIDWFDNYLELKGQSPNITGYLNLLSNMKTFSNADYQDVILSLSKTFEISIQNVLGNITKSEETAIKKSAALLIASYNSPIAHAISKLI